MNAYDVSNINVASLNIGINQEMLQSHKKWPKHGKKLGQLVDRFFHADNNDLVFLSEFGDYRQGPKSSGVDLQALFEHAVGAGVQYAASGAFCTIYNGRTPDATLIERGFQATRLAHQADMHWQAFLLKRRIEMCPEAGGASQSARSSDGVASQRAEVGLLVGNMHIIQGRNSSCTLPQKKRIVKDFLNFVPRFDNCLLSTVCVTLIQCSRMIFSPSSSSSSSS